MLYLSYVWQIIASKYGMIAVSLGNVLVLFCFLRARIKWWLFLVLLSLTYLSLPLIFQLYVQLFGPQAASSYLVAFSGYFADVLVLFSFKEGFWKKITLIFTLHIMTRMFTFWGYILHLPLNAVMGVNWDVQASATLVISVMYAAISLVCWVELKEKMRKLIQSEQLGHNWIVLGSIAISAKLIIDASSDYVFSLNPYSEKKIIWAMIALCTFIFAVLVLYVYNTQTIMKNSELKVAADRLFFEKEAQQRYYETQFHNQEELRRMKHDMKGHLNTISRLLAEDDRDSALRYLTELRDFALSNQKSLYCEDPYLNAVVANYVELFAQNDTQFEQDIRIGNLELHPVELCLVLNNALQNALEASLMLPPENRYVKLQIKTTPNHLLIRITNRFNRQLRIDNGSLRSTKESGSHGYGLSSIRHAAESLGGFADYKIENDLFVLDIAL